jgi:DNA-binding transcriptional regulator YhcF (GntR family)
MTAPYLLIAAEIEQRIATGALAPGDRVPSTRAITKEFGVAIATATKALAELRTRGAVTVIPGTGTVVAAGPTPTPPRAVQSRPTGIDRAAIVAAAIAIADAEGLGAVTMRRLAVDLGVATMSLYQRVSGKEDLLVAMMDKLMGADTWPAVPPPGWRAQLEFVARRQWRGYLVHPWLAQVVSLTRPQLAPGAMMHTEWVLRAIKPFRLSSRAQIYVVLTLFGHVKTVAIGLEEERQAEQDTGLDIEEWFEKTDAEFAPHINSGRFPTLASIDGDGDVDFDLAALFEFGLTIVLDGIGAMLERQSSDR